MDPRPCSSMSRSIVRLTQSHSTQRYSASGGTETFEGRTESPLENLVATRSVAETRFRITGQPMTHAHTGAGDSLPLILQTGTPASALLLASLSTRKAIAVLTLSFPHPPLSSFLPARTSAETLEGMTRSELPLTAFQKTNSGSASTTRTTPSPLTERRKNGCLNWAHGRVYLPIGSSLGKELVLLFEAFLLYNTQPSIKPPLRDLPPSATSQQQEENDE